MRGVVIHAPKDLRVEEIAAAPLGPRDVRVRIEAGGICGSDLHYYHHGGFGTVRIQEPMALGHEIAGTVDEVGSEVSRVSPGTRVAVNPSQPCDAVPLLPRGPAQPVPRHAVHRAAPCAFPHVQGGFRAELTVDEEQAVPIAAGDDDGGSRHGRAARGLPARRPPGRAAAGREGAGDRLRPDRGACGRGGALRRRGRDRRDRCERLPAVARRAGRRDRAINIARGPAGTGALHAGQGHASTCCSRPPATRPRCAAPSTPCGPAAIVVQLGLGGDMKLPINIIVAKELQLRGTFRFDEEFQLAVDLMGKGADRREAAAQRDDAVRARGGGLRAGLRPLPRHEGATRVLTGR